MFSPRTDLALDAAALKNPIPGQKIDGVEVDSYNSEDVTVTKVTITNSRGEKTIGKRMGNYVTVECRNIRHGNPDSISHVSEVFKKELKSIVDKFRHNTILVVGLGNRFITPDSLGPKVSDGIEVTRHLGKNNVNLCTVSPGVLGITGIETLEIIEGIVRKINPDIIIAVDALASGSMERICTTIQIADTGITPGAGVGNKRKELSQNTLGVPVIAVGVPTVVDAATVANDAMEHLLSALEGSVDVDDVLRDDSFRLALIKKSVNPYFGELIVTPSEIDSVIDTVAGVISVGINDICNKRDCL